MFADHLEDWRQNERAFEAALAELKAPAAVAGLILTELHFPIEGWTRVLSAEVRARGVSRVLAGIDVGLDSHGAMLLQTLPGDSRRFSSFHPRDKDFYVRRLRRLVAVAIASNARDGFQEGAGSPKAD